jgi:hypothetical protein
MVGRLVEQQQVHGQYQQPGHVQAAPLPDGQCPHGRDERLGPEGAEGQQRILVLLGQSDRPAAKASSTVRPGCSTVTS